MPTVLFTDADRGSREVYAWLLSSYGFEVETAGDGLKCLANLRRIVPDLLILDLELPWGGGVLAVLREAPRLLPSRVVLTSAVAPAHVLNSLAWPHPVVQALSKPFQLSALFERAALAALIEHEQRSSGARPRPAPADQACMGLPGASSVAGSWSVRAPAA